MGLGRSLGRNGSRSNAGSNRAGAGTTGDFFGEEKRTDGERKEERVTAQEGKGKSAFTQTLVANDGSQSQRGEKEVYASERQQAEDTIHRQEIPVGYRNYLRRYFEALQPSSKDADSKVGDDK